MPFVDPLSRVEDMADAIALVEEALAGKTFADYAASALLRNAVERNLQRTSDASRGIPDAMKAGLPGIPWDDLAELGDHIQQDYDTLDARAMWGWATETLSSVKAAVERLDRLARHQQPRDACTTLAMATERNTLGASLAERERVLRILREHEAEIRAQGVTRLRLFGSMARGEAGPESDVDLLADIDRGAKFSLIDLVSLQDFLGDLVGRKVELGTTVENTRPRIRQRIEADAVEVF